MGNELFNIQPREGFDGFVVSAGGGKLVGAYEVPKPANPIERNQTGGLKLRYWGDDNLYPQQLIEWIEKSPILSSKLLLNALILTCGDFEYGIETENGFQKKFDKEVETWKRQTNLKRNLGDLAIELVKFWNGFVELTLSKDRKKIALFTAQDSAFCRISRNDLPETRDKPQTVFINANWDKGDTENSELTIKRELIDEYGDRDKQVRNGEQKSYIYRIMGPSSGRVAYGEPPWTSAIKSKWLQYSLAIPEAKLAKIENGMLVFYHIEVPEGYWRDRYPEWDQKPEQRPAWKKETQDEWIKNLTDKNNWGKVVTTTYKQFEDGSGKTGHHILIKVLENPFTKTELIEDSFEASSQIFQALMIDATLNGTIPGKQMGAGSGSDKRVAWNIAVMVLRYMIDLLLEPVQFCFDYNKWDYVVRMKNPVIDTLDNVNPEKRNLNPA